MQFLAALILRFVTRMIRNTEKYVRLLADKDKSLLDSFLSPYTPFAYFMRSNAKVGGIVYEGKQYQADYFGYFENNELKGVLAHHFVGGLQIFAPIKSSRVLLAKEFMQYRSKNPRKITIILGPLDDVQDMCEVLGINEEHFRYSGGHEFLYQLDLSDLKPIKSDLITRRANEQDLAKLIILDNEYAIEGLGEAKDRKVSDETSARIRLRLSEGSVFVLEKDGDILSFSCAHGFLPDWKWVGPVYTPPKLRGQGYAKTITAASLNIVKSEGVKYAGLFARNPIAMQAYEKLGFKQIGDWKMDLLKEPIYRF